MVGQKVLGLCIFTVWVVLGPADEDRLVVGGAGVVSHSGVDRAGHRVNVVRGIDTRRVPDPDWSAEDVGHGCRSVCVNCSAGCACGFKDGGMVIVWEVCMHVDVDVSMSGELEEGSESESLITVFAACDAEHHTVEEAVAITSGMNGVDAGV